MHKLDRSTARTAKSLASNTRWLFVGSILLLGFSIASLTAAIIIQNNTKSSLVSRTQLPFKIGRQISAGSVILSISNLKYSDGTSHFSAPTGQHYAIITFTVKNKSDTPISVLPSIDTYMKDSAGKVTYLSPYELENPFRAGELLPGEQISGELSYLVPKTSNPKFYVDGIWSGGVIPFDIK